MADTSATEPSAEPSVDEAAAEAAPAEATASAQSATATAQTTTQGTATQGTATQAAAEGRPNRRKVREGLVVSDSMDATVVVAVIERVRHPRYGKTVQRTKRLYVHDAEGTAKVGDRVRVVETRPMSKLKRWRLAEIMERAR